MFNNASNNISNLLKALVAEQQLLSKKVVLLRKAQPSLFKSLKAQEIHSKKLIDGLALALEDKARCKAIHSLAKITVY